MRKRYIIVAVIVGALLLRLDDDFATLRFGDSVRPDSGHGEMKLIYREQMEQLILAAGINPDKVTMRVQGRDDTLVLSTRMIRGIDDSQKAAIQRALKTRLDGRARDIQARFTLLPDQMPGQREAFVQAVKAIPQTYEADLVFDKVLLGIRYDAPQPGSTSTPLQPKRSGEVSCNLGFRVEPFLPFANMKSEFRQEGQAPYVTLGKSDLSPYRYFPVPVELNFTQAEMQAYWQQGQLLPSTELSGGPNNLNNRKGVELMELQLGSLGKITHTGKQVSYYQHQSLKKRCLNQAAELGRPFTFFVGDSLDRLEQFTFHSPADVVTAFYRVLYKERISLCQCHGCCLSQWPGCQARHTSSA